MPLVLAATFLACGQTPHSSPSIVPASHESDTREPWMKSPIQQLAQMPANAADSVITVRRNSSTELDVIYAFNNSCHASIEAYTRREGNILSVRFLKRMPNETNRSDADLLLCPAAILIEAFQVTVGETSPGPLTIRAFVGDGKSWRMVKETAALPK